jgi:TPR repeat protein
MSLKGKLSGILSLSAASAALVQNSAVANLKGVEIDVSTSNPSLKTESTPAKLTFDVPEQEDLLRLYAGHRSHSSHSSHSSHYSGSGHYSSSGYTVPSYPATPRPSYPITTPAPSYQYAPPKPIVPKTDSDLPRRIFDGKRRSAAQGIARFQYEVGLAYLTGDGVEKKEQTGRLYLELAARNNYPGAVIKVTEWSSTNAQTKVLGVSTNSLVSTNLTINKNSTDPIIQLMTKAADGSAVAQFELAMRYMTGDGIEKNYERAQLLFEMSELQGNAEATGALKILKIKISQSTTDKL